VLDPSLPITGIDSTMATFLAGYTRFFGLWCRTTSVVLQQPYSSDETADKFDRILALKNDYEGIRDCSATLSLNVLDTPFVDRLSPKFNTIHHTFRP
jgi:hypothetical protein